MLRFFRLGLMVLTLLVATGAQLILDHGALGGALGRLIPVDLLHRFPWLLPVTNWRANDSAALWAALAAGLSFGLVAPNWPLWRQTRAAAAPASGRRALPGAMAAVAVGCAGAVTLTLALGGPEAGWMQWAWLAAIALLLTAAAWRTLPGADQHLREPRTGQGWALLLWLLLAFTALWIGWQGVALPVAVDRAAARSGLAAVTLLTEPTAGFFSPGAVGAPGLGHAPLALLLWLTQDGLLALHLLAGGAALLLVAAVWLLAGELFLRPDGAAGALAFLAAGLTAVALPLLHFGRATPGLLAVGAAVLAGWLLLRGLRYDSSLAIAASGMLVGAAALLDRSCLPAPAILGLWWVGVAVLRPPMLTPLRWSQVGWWLAGLFVLGGPAAGVWLREPTLLPTYARGAHLLVDGATSWPMIDTWTNLRNSFLGLMWLADAGSIGFPGPFVHSLAVPLLWLALGALLVNLDRFVGWALTTWLLVTLLFASTTTILAPDWTTLLLLLPGVGLTLAYVLDRFYVAWRAPAGEWVDTPALYLALGLLVAIGFSSALAYPAFAATNGDTASYIGRAVRDAAPNAVFLAASANAPTVAPTDEIVQFLSLPGATPEILDAAALPPALPPQSHLFILPADRAAQEAVLARYPGSVVRVVRDLHANPRLIVVRLP